MVTAPSALWSTTAGIATTASSANWSGPVELGEADAGNLSAKNIIALADALGVDVRALV